MPPNDHDRDSVERRLAAVERAVADDEPLDRTNRVDELESRVAELEAAVQALRGYVGSVRAVNEDVERRADRAFRKARAVERILDPADREDEPFRDAGSDHDSDSDVDTDEDRGGETADHPLATLCRRL